MNILPLLLALAASPQAAAPSPADPVEADWRSIPDDEIMVITFADKRTVTVRLASRHAPEHVANIRLLARSGWWDDASVYRVQENWVTQWGDATEKKPLPPTIKKLPAAEFDIAAFTPAQRLTRPDPRVTASGVSADGWPMATNGRAAWLPHCYGMVGVARDASPDTGTGAELFTPIGQSARRLDRNYTVVGRIIEGMGHMASMPRSDAPMGVYADAAQRTAIVSVRLASDMPAAERPRFQYRAADNQRYAALVNLRENPAAPTIGFGGAEICEIPLPTRRAPG